MLALASFGLNANDMGAWHFKILKVFVTTVNLLGLSGSVEVKEVQRKCFSVNSTCLLGSDPPPIIVNY